MRRPPLRSACGCPSSTRTRRRAGGGCPTTSAFCRGCSSTAIPSREAGRLAGEGPGESAELGRESPEALGREKLVGEGPGRERAGRGEPEFVTTFSDGIIIKSNF